MSTISRGVRNAFRNPLRTISVTAILGISLSLVVVMLAARNAVDNRITEVKKTVGNTVTISPAGARGFLGGGEPLTSAQVTTVKSTPHITSVDVTVDAQLQTTTDTNLKSGVDAGSLGRRGFRAFRGGQGSNANQQPPANFTPPILAVGTNTAANGGTLIGDNITLTSGTMFDATSDSNVALIGKTLADKNTLTAGSTFTAYGTTITVSGIYDAGNQFANNSLLFPLTTLQRLSGQKDQVTSMVAHVDSVENISQASAAVSTTLGAAADVTNSSDTVKQTIAPLNNIRTIATTSLFGALIAAAVVTLLTMVMIVRERRKEIAVLKALGGSDASIVTQFMTESVVLSLLGSVIGTVLGFILSNPILKALLNSTTQSAGAGGNGGPGGNGTFRIAAGGFRAVRGAVQSLQAVVDIKLIAYGVLAAVVVAIIGSSFPAWLISKIRPAEVLRSE